MGSRSITTGVRFLDFGSRKFWKSTLPLIVLLGGGIAFLSIFAWSGRERAWSGLNDFLPFYAGGRLAFSGDLYNQDRVLAEEHAAAGVFGENLHFIRPPWFAAVLWPLAQLRYSRAHLVWEALMLAAIGGFVLWWHPAGRLANLAMLCFSIPALLSMMNGQDVPLLLLCMTGAVVLHRRGRLFAAGLLLALCQTKFHLFLPVWIVFLAAGRWRVLAGMVTGDVSLAALSCALAGWAWPGHYLESIANSAVTVGTANMPTFYYLLATLPISVGWLLLSGLAVILAAWFAGKRFDFETALAMVPALTIPFANHTNVCDALLLTPLLMIAISRNQTVSMPLAVALISPLPWLFCLVGHPWSLLAPALLVVLLTVMLVIEPGRRVMSETPSAEKLRVPCLN